MLGNLCMLEGTKENHQVNPQKLKIIYFTSSCQKKQTMLGRSGMAEVCREGERSQGLRSCKIPKALGRAGGGGGKRIPFLASSTFQP